MKNLWKIAQPLGLLCLLGAAGVAGLNTFAVIAASLGFERPFNYFQYLRVPLWSVALPALGILALLPLALRRAFTQESAAEEERVVEPMNWRRVVERWRGRFHLRPA
ncbi:MAG: hypothetical protein ACREA2_23105 [Blastocatellia bacterium]